MDTWIIESPLFGSSSLIASLSASNYNIMLLHTAGLLCCHSWLIAISWIIKICLFIVLGLMLFIFINGLEIYKERGNGLICFQCMLSICVHLAYYPEHPPCQDF